jgi:hypothetical protein
MDPWHVDHLVAKMLCVTVITPRRLLGYALQLKIAELHEDLN